MELILKLIKINARELYDVSKLTYRSY